MRIQKVELTFGPKVELTFGPKVDFWSLGRALLPGASQRCLPCFCRGTRCDTLVWMALCASSCVPIS